MMCWQFSHMCSLCFSAGVSLDGQTTSLRGTLWRFITSLSLQPSVPPVWFIHPQWTPLCPNIIPSSTSLHWPGLGLSSLSACFICSSSDSHPPELLCPISPFTWYKLSSPVKIFSHNSLFLYSLCSLSPWPHWPVWAPRHYLCRLPLLWWPPLYSKRPLTLLN